MIRRLIPLSVLAVLVCILLWPVLAGDQVLLPGTMLQRMSPWEASVLDNGDARWNALTWDAIAYFYPARTLLGQAINSGELPLWNPHQMCGTPFLADGQSAALYPPNFLFAVLPPARAFGLLAALHLLAAGLFTYVFLRGLNLSRAASTFGGVGFMLSGFAITWLELPGFLSSGVWLPLILHLSRLAHERGSVYYAAGAGAALALCLVGGHPQIAFYCLLAVGLYWVYIVVSAWREVAVWRSVGLACLTFALGFAMAAPQLLSSAELAAVSHRGGAVPTAAGYAAYSSLAMPWQKLIVLLIPDFFGNPSRFGFWYTGQYAEYCGYVGLLPLLLMFSAFGGEDKSRRQARFFGVLAALALLMALGTAVNRLFYFDVPGFARSGSPARALFLFMFSVPVLGAIGLDRVLKMGAEGKTRAVLRVLLSGAALLIFGIILLKFYLASFRAEFVVLPAHLPEMRAFPVLFLAGLITILLIVTGTLRRRPGGILVVGILAADLLGFGLPYNQTCAPPEVYPSTELTSYLKEEAEFSRIMPLNREWSLAGFPESVLPPNSASVYGLYDVQGYDSLYPVRYKALLDAAAGRDSCPRENGNMVFARNPDSPVYDLLGVRWIISMRPLGGECRRIDECFVYENTDALPRAFIVHTVEYAEDEEILRRIVGGETNLRRAALVSPEDAKHLKPWWDEDFLRAMKPAAADRADITGYTCNTVTLEVDAVRDGVLVLTDQYFPGWKALVDGRAAEVIQVDYAFRAIAIPRGEHRVVFSYEPRSFGAGLWIAGSAFAPILGLAIFGGVRGLRYGHEMHT